MAARARPGRGALVARLVAAVAALAGVVLLLLGVRAAGSSSAAATSAGTTRLDGVAALTTVPSVLGGGASGVRLRASASAASTQVFIGVARAGDAAAWLGDLARVDVLGPGADGALDIARKDGATTAPDPVRADVWVASAVGQGAAELDWTPAPGQWRAVVVGGTAAGGLERVDVAWTRPAGSSAAPAEIATGLLLLAGGGAGLLVLRRRAARGPGDGYDDYDDYDDGYDDPDDGHDDVDDEVDDADADDDANDHRGGGTGPGAWRPAPVREPETTVLPRAHGRRRAGTPPWTRAVLPLGLAMAVGLAGCSGGSSGAAAGSGASGPAGAGPAAGAASGVPAVLVPQAEAVLDKVDAALAAVRRSGRLADAGGRVLGPFAEGLTAELAVAARTRATLQRSTATDTATPPAVATPPAAATPGAEATSSALVTMARDRLLLTQTAAWPRFFVVAGAAPGLPTPVVRVLVSPSAREPYGVWAQPVLLPGATLPEVAAASRGAAELRPDTTGLVATPAAAAQGYADVLTRSTASPSADLFAPDEFRRQVASRFASDRTAVSAVGTVTTAHAVAPDGVLAFRSADGGAVVVAELRQTYTVTVRPGAGNVKVDAALAALGGRPAYSTRLVRTSVEVVVLTVPPTGGGLVRVVAASKDDVGVTGS